MRIVFMGTPEFAVPSLRALVEAGHEIAGVITQPDRPAGRGHKLTACPVKLLAQSLGLEVFQFERLRRPEGVACLRALAPDVVVTAAFGQILTQELLDIPRYGTVNVHASLLPAHRGSAPINWCILMGDRTAGVTTMLTDVGLDTGDMLLKAETEIGEMETAGELTRRLSEMGAALLIKTLARYPFGDMKPEALNEAQASYEPMLSREAARIDWTMPAAEIARRVRAFNPWPCAWTEGPDGRMKVYLARAVAAEGEAPCGSVVAADPKRGLMIACGEGWLEVFEMQMPGAKKMNARDYLRGRSIASGTRFE